MFAHYQTSSSEETIELGKRLAQRLTGGDTILFFGELGSGKTHFIKGLAQGLGILMTIKSPTYAYVNKYPIPNGGPNRGPNGGEIFYHYDLYRMNEGDDFASIGLEESLEDPEAINAVEWADRLGGNIPKQCVLVYLSEAGTKRDIRIEFLSPTLLDEGSIESYYEEWATPANVRRHCRMVTHVAMTVAEALMRKDEIINTNLLYVSGMLHDMARICDFDQMNRDHFTEQVTQSKWDKWLELRERFKGQDHPQIAFDQLASRGFSDTAEVIRLHQSSSLATDAQLFDIIEKKLLNYADKRVKHDHVVSLQERFRDGRERYGAHNNERVKRLFEDLEQATIEMERELFRGLDIKPEDIKTIGL